MINARTRFRQHIAKQLIRTVLNYVAEGLLSSNDAAVILNWVVDYLPEQD